MLLLFRLLLLLCFLNPLTLFAFTLKNTMSTEVKILMEYSQMQNGQKYNYYCTNIPTLFGANQIKYPLASLCGAHEEDAPIFYLIQAVMINGGSVVNCDIGRKINDQATLVVSGGASEKVPFVCQIK